MGDAAAAAAHRRQAAAAAKEKTEASFPMLFCISYLHCNSNPISFAKTATLQMQYVVYPRIFSPPLFRDRSLRVRPSPPSKRQWRRERKKSGKEEEEEEEERRVLSLSSPFSSSPPLVT